MFFYFLTNHSTSHCLTLGMGDGEKQCSKEAMFEKQSEFTTLEIILMFPMWFVIHIIEKTVSLTTETHGTIVEHHSNEVKSKLLIRRRKTSKQGRVRQKMTKVSTSSIDGIAGMFLSQTLIFICAGAQFNDKNDTLRRGSAGRKNKTLFAPWHRNHIAFSCQKHIIHVCFS